MRGNSSWNHSISSDKELAMHWNNQGRLHVGEESGSEPSERVITVPGSHNKDGSNQGSFNDIREDETDKCDTNTWYVVVCLS